MSSLKDRVEEAIARGYGPAELARAAGVDDAAVSHWRAERTKSIKAKTAFGLAELTGRSPAWWAQGKTANSGEWRRPHPLGGHPVKGVAQFLGEPASDDAPTLLPWESVLSSVVLPDRFRLAVPDDALAPSTPKGTILIFSTAAPPVFGHGVLVRDAAGHRHVRRYAQGPAGRWVAEARNSAYLTLDSAEGAEVLAVVIGRETGEV